MEFDTREELTVIDLVFFGKSEEKEFYALTLSRPKGRAWQNWKAGQFVMLRPVSWGAEHTWARPFSICRVTEQSLVLFFQVVGRGTKKIANLKFRDKVVIWGPLGTHFESVNKPTLLLAGGIGIAPFAGYIEQHKNQNKLSMLFAHRSPAMHYPVETFTSQIEIETVHERSFEELPYIIERIQDKMLATKQNDGLVLACGPMPFLKSIWRYAKEIQVDTQLSLEQRMACGIGACLGCVAITSEDFSDKSRANFPVQTCTKGPIFWASDLNLDEGEN